MLCGADVMPVTGVFLGKRHHAFLHPATRGTIWYHLFLLCTRVHWPSLVS